MKKTLLTAVMFMFVAGFAYAANPAPIAPAAPAAPAKQEMKREGKERPCKADREKFCANVKKGKDRIKNCLKAHENELTPACKAKLEKHQDKKAK
jgi:hypothetical protein